MKKIFTLILLLAIAFAGKSQVNHVVISQIYGGGGNSGAQYTNDYIELYNPTTSPIDISNWQVAYTSSSGTTWGKTIIPSGSVIGAGRYFLIQESAGAGTAAALPTPDVSGGTLAMSSTTGKVALVSDTMTLAANAAPTPVANPARGITGSVIDFVGYGTATNYEGTGPAPAPSNTTAIFRKVVPVTGMQDTDNNSADFQTGAPAPRNSTLPLNLLSFNAALNNGATNLNWTTANEVNVAGFQIERSMDGKNFSSIATTPVMANGAATKNYSYVDTKVAAGTNYYRLKMVDNDGSFKYSQIVTVKTKAIGVSVYPNPVKSDLTIQHEAGVKGASISVVNFEGKQVMNVNVQAGATQTTVDAAKLAAGTYMIIYTNNGERSTKQFVKQ